jgi:hypothetical protein
MNSSILRQLNILRVLQNANPWQILLATWTIGVVLVVWSFLLGSGWFTAKIYVDFGGKEPVMEKWVALGYATQLNYGPWYLAGCPILFFCISLAAKHSANDTNPFSKGVPSFAQIGDKLWVAGLGCVLFAIFVGKNIAVEIDAYQNLALGWVQAEGIRDAGQKLTMTKEKILLPGKK